MKYTLKSKKYLLETIKLKIPIKPSGQYCNPNKIDLERHWTNKILQEIKLICKNVYAW